MDAPSLQRWITHPEVLDKDTLYELRTLLARYPYCQSLRLLYLKNLYLLHDATYSDELRKCAFYIADRRTLFFLIEGDKYRLPKHTNPTREVAAPRQEKPQEEPELDRTLSLIDTYLMSTPEAGMLQDELDYTVDYTAYLGDEPLPEEAPADQDQEELPHLIDAFIAKAESAPSMKLKPLDEEEDEEEEDEEIEPPASTYPKEEDEDIYFTETLAKIYIKQRRYSKALEIIKKLNLKYPKKNVYFADQIRFLEKLIINTKS